MKEKRRDAVRANNVPKYGNQFKWKGSLNKRYLIWDAKDEELIMQWINEVSDRGGGMCGLEMVMSEVQCSQVVSLPLNP